MTTITFRVLYSFAAGALLVGLLVFALTHDFEALDRAIYFIVAVMALHLCRSKHWISE